MALQVLWSCCKLPRSLFSESPRLLDYTGSCQYSKSEETEISPLGSPLKSWNMDTYYNSFFLGRSWELGLFSHKSVQSWVEELWKMIWSKYKHSSLISVVPLLGALSCQQLNLDERKAICLGSPPKCQNIEHVVQSSISIPRERLGAGNFLPISPYWVRGGEDGKWLLQTFQQVWLKHWVQNSLNSFLDFSQREFSV